jgi:hypothetical protein
LHRRKCTLPQGTSGCVEKLMLVSTGCSLFYATTTPNYCRSQFYLVAEVETNPGFFLSYS